VYNPFRCAGFQMEVRYKTLVSRCGVLAVCALLALWITSPIVATGSWYHGNQAPLNPYRLSQFCNAFAAGVWYPRWMPEMFGGYGYPTFLFYQPGYFFLTLPLTYIAGLLHACEAGIFLALMAGMFGAYKLARLWHARWLSLCFAVVFIFSHDIASTLFIRSDLSELYAMLVCPWNAYYLLRLASGVRSQEAVWRGAFGFTASTFLIIITHPFVAFWWLPFAAGLMVMQTLTLPYDRRVLTVGAICLALAVTLAAPYWFTVLQLKHQVHYEWGLLPFNRAFGLMIGKPPFLQAWGYALVALLGFAFAWRHRTMRYVACVCVLYFFMMTAWSRPVWAFAYPVLQYTQFSLRLLAPLTTIVYLGVLQLGLPLMRWHGKDRRHARLCVGLAVAAACGVMLVEERHFHLLWALNPADRLQPFDYYRVIPEQERSSQMTATHNNELTPRLAQPDELLNRYADGIPIAQFVTPPDRESTLMETPDSTPHHIRLRLDLHGVAVVRLNQLYFPGWKILMNGQEVRWAASLPRAEERDRMALPSPDGRILLAFPQPGVYRIEAWYDGPPGWLARNVAVAATSTLLILLLWPVLRVKEGTAH